MIWSAVLSASGPLPAELEEHGAAVFVAGLAPLVGEEGDNAAAAAAFGTVQPSV